MRMSIFSLCSRAVSRARSPALIISLTMRSKRSSLCSSVISVNPPQCRCASSRGSVRHQLAGWFGLTPGIHGEIVEERRVEEQAVEPVEQAAVAGQYLRRVLGVGAALERALGQ